MQSSSSFHTNYYASIYSTGTAGIGLQCCKMLCVCVQKCRGRKSTVHRHDYLVLFVLFSIALHSWVIGGNASSQFQCPGLQA